MPEVLSVASKLSSGKSDGVVPVLITISNFSGGVVSICSFLFKVTPQSTWFLNRILRYWTPSETKSLVILNSSTGGSRIASSFKFGTLSAEVAISIAIAFTSNGNVQLKSPSVFEYQTSGSKKAGEPISGARGGSPKISASSLSSSGSGVGVVGVGVGVVGVGVGVGVVAAAIVKVPGPEL